MSGAPDSDEGPEEAADTPDLWQRTGLCRSSMRGQHGRQGHHDATQMGIQQLRLLMVLVQLQHNLVVSNVHVMNS